MGVAVGVGEGVGVFVGVGVGVGVLVGVGVKVGNGVGLPEGIGRTILFSRHCPSMENIGISLFCSFACAVSDCRGKTNCNPNKIVNNMTPAEAA